MAIWIGQIMQFIVFFYMWQKNFVAQLLFFTMTAVGYEDNTKIYTGRYILVFT